MTEERLDGFLNLIKDEKVPPLSLSFDLRFREKAETLSSGRLVESFRLLRQPSLAAALFAACAFMGLFIWKAPLRSGYPPRVVNSAEMVNSALVSARHEALRAQADSQTRKILDQAL